MKKAYKMQELDCANCAAKIESGIKKIEGVQEATVNFMTQKLTIEADEDNMESILNQANKICRKIEPNCRILF